VVACAALAFFLTPLLIAGQNSDQDKTRSENVHAQFYFMIAGPPGLLLKNRVNPVYPPAARIAGIEGVVSLDVSVAADGNVQSVKALSGLPLLAAAARDAVRQWNFVPTLRLPTHGMVWVEFRLVDTGPAVDDSKYLPDRRFFIGPNLPDYPAAALWRGIQGQVALEVTLDPDGKITDLRVLKSDNDLLTSAAVGYIQKPYHLWTCNRPEMSPCMQRMVVNYELNHQFLPTDGPLPIVGKIIEAPSDLLLTYWAFAMYPADAQKHDLEGDVQIKLTVDQKGEVSDAEVLSGPEPLQGAALKAAVECRFAPPSAAPAEVILDYRFWVPK
jgi:TonB family protein